MITQHEIELAYDNYSAEIFQYILRYIPSRDSAEDVLHDVYVKLINYSMKTNVDSRNLRALLYKIAKTKCIDESRKSSHRREDLHDASVMNLYPDKSDDRTSDLSDILNDLIDMLCEPEKTIIILRRNGLTFRDVAEATGLSERTVKRKMKSALEIIGNKLVSMNIIKNHGISPGSDSL